MASKTLNTSISLGGVSIAGKTIRTAEGQIGQDCSLAAGKAGTLTTRTDANTGVATLSTGHGIITGNVVDVFWSGGARYGMTCTVATNAVTIDGGGGTDLPATTTALVLCKETVINADFDGDDAKIVSVLSTQRGYVQFLDSGSAVLFAVELATANEDWTWMSGKGVSNPLTGNPVDSIVVSNASSTTAATLTFACLYDSVP